MKKGQSLLVFFGVQLICIILFFVVLLSLLTMSRSVSYRVQQFDEETTHILITRWLLSSSDCLAYKSNEIFVTESGIDFTSRVFPYVVDVNKLWDYEHINCIRMDTFDLKIDLGDTHDALFGSGIALKYDIIAFDLSGNEIRVLTGPNSSSTYQPQFDDSEPLLEYTTTSLLGRIYKQPIHWQAYYRTTSRCVEKNWLDGGSNITSHWIEHDGSRKMEKCFDWSYDYRQFDYTRSPSKPDIRYRADYVFGFPFHILVHGDVITQRWAAIIMELNSTEEENGETYMRMSIWHHQNMTCSGHPARQKIFPVTLYDNGEFKQGAIFIQTCLIKGSEYTGLNPLNFQHESVRGEA